MTDLMMTTREDFKILFLVLIWIKITMNIIGKSSNDGEGKMKKPREQKSVNILKHIDGRRKVRVYRNLHKECYSVKQDGLVKCHADQVTLQEVKFIVSKVGQKRVRDEKKKNVHAYLEGYVVDARQADNIVDGKKSDTDLEAGLSDWESIYYNPYECDGFMNTSTERIAEFAEFASLDPDVRVILSSDVSYESEVYV